MPPRVSAAPLRRIVQGGQLFWVQCGPGADAAAWDDVPGECGFDATAVSARRDRLAAADPARHYRVGRSYSHRYELYECGHLKGEKSDKFGPTNAARRRCTACAAGRPAAWPLADTPADAYVTDPVSRATRLFRMSLWSAVHRQRDVQYGPFAREARLAAHGRFAVAMPVPAGGGPPRPLSADPDHTDRGIPAMWAFLKREYGSRDGYTLVDLLTGHWAKGLPAADVETLTPRTPAQWVALAKGEA
jgi:hypothetical protein